MVQRYKYYGMPARSGPALYRHWEHDEGEWVRYEDHAALCEAVLALNALDTKARLLAHDNLVPSAEFSRQLSDQWAETVRLAKGGK